jgi:hypothetical protein
MMQGFQQEQMHLIKSSSRRLLAWLLVPMALAEPMSPAKAALIPPFFSDVVVALGVDQVVLEPGQPPQQKWVTEGTGFFYGVPANNDPDPAKRLYSVFMVTAKHVVRDHPKELGDLRIRVNPTASSSPVKELPLPSDNWFFHPNLDIDVAIIDVDLGELRKQGYQSTFFPGDLAAADKKKLRSDGVANGDGIFVLGFPMNLAGAQRNYVIVRQGAIARITEMLDNASSTFMIDALVFPGNSGGPVVLKPEAMAIAGTQSHAAAQLIGMVASYRPYSEVAVSQQTHQPRVLFQENSGLAEVLPIDYVDETIRAYQVAHPESKDGRQ